MQVLLALTDAEPVSRHRSRSRRSALPEPGRGVAAQLAELLAQQGFSILANPFHLWSLARLGTGTMAAMGKLMWRSPDPGTIFRGQLGVPKRVAWSGPWHWLEVKALGRAVGGTVNDVMLLPQPARCGATWRAMASRCKG